MPTPPQAPLSASISQEQAADVFASAITERDETGTPIPPPAQEPEPAAPPASDDPPMPPTMEERLHAGVVTTADIDMLLPRLTPDEYATLRSEAQRQDTQREVAKLDRARPTWRDEIHDAVQYAERLGIPAARVMEVTEAGPLLVLFQAAAHEKENARLQEKLTARARRAQREDLSSSEQDVKRARKAFEKSHRPRDAARILEGFIGGPD